MPKIPVSFKKTTRDMKLYTEVKSKEEQSEFVKDALEYYVKYLGKKERKEKEKQEEME